MSSSHNRSEGDHTRKHRRNNRDCSPHTKISECSDARSTDSDSAEHGSRHVSQYHGARRDAVDLGHEPRDDRPRRGAVDFGREPRGGHSRQDAIDLGRGPRDDPTLSESEDNKGSKGSPHMRRGSAAERDDFRGFLDSRRSEHRLATTVRKEGVTESSLPVHGEDYRRWRDMRGRPEHLDRRSDRTSGNARVDRVDDDFEAPKLQRATALPRDGAPRMDEPARYSYYKPHGPRPEAGPELSAPVLVAKYY